MVSTGEGMAMKFPAFIKSLSLLTNPDQVVGIQNLVGSEQLYKGPDSVCVVALDLHR